jgi:hypothetical protein
MRQSLKKSPFAVPAGTAKGEKTTTKMNLKFVKMNSKILVKICQLFLGRDKC